MRLLLFISILLVAASVPAFACTCDGVSTVDAEFKQATAVFTGKFIGSEYRKGIKSEMVEMHLETMGDKGPYEMLVFKFEVKTHWKGDLTREVILISDNARLPNGTEVVSSCGLGFEQGREYLVYAFGKGDEFGSGACSRTASLRRAGKDIARLNKLAKPRPPLL